MNRMKTMPTRLFLFLILINKTLPADAQTWTLWASGLPVGVFPKLAVAPNHDIFYGLTGTGGTRGIVHKANTTTATGSFVALPTIPYPASVTNDVQTLIANVNNEPIVGIFRSNAADPFLFRYDNATSSWLTVSVSALPNLGAFCAAIAPTGHIWIGTKWGFVYRSTNNGQTPNGLVTLPNDYVIAATGYQPNFAFLTKIGIHLSDDQKLYPQYDKVTQLSNMPNIYLAGVVCGGMDTHVWFIENSRIHADTIVEHIIESQKTGVQP